MLRPIGRYFIEIGANSTGMDIHLVLFRVRETELWKGPHSNWELGKGKVVRLERLYQVLEGGSLSLSLSGMFQAPAYVTASHHIMRLISIYLLPFSS